MRQDVSQEQHINIGDEEYEDNKDRLLWTRQETARQLSISLKKVSDLIDKGALPVVRIGRCIRIERQSVYHYIESNREYNSGCVESVLSQSGESLCDSIDVNAFTTLPTNRAVENRLNALLKPVINK